MPITFSTTIHNDSNILGMVRDETLSQLIALCKSLHKKPSNESLSSSSTTTTTSLSLRQLVPVHAALCRAVAAGDPPHNDDDDDDDEPPTLKDALLESNLCRSILQQSKEEEEEEEEEEEKEAQKLLTLQYLLHRHHQAKSSSSSLSGLAVVVLPYLLPKGTDEFYENGVIPEDMREALLDACLPTARQNTTDPPAFLTECLAQTHNASSSSSSSSSTTSTTAVSLSSWIVVCRVLLRLHQSFPTNNTTIHETIYRVVLQGINQAVQSQLSFLKPLTTWLLPILLTTNAQKEEQQPPYIQQIWNRLVELVPTDTTELDDSLALTITSVLCTILPSLLEGKKGTEQQQQQPLQHQAVLWHQIIHPSLCRGMNRELRSGFPHDEISIEQTLRRRGLYLLGRLVLHAESNNKNEKSKRNNYSSSPTKMWKKYLTCFETLEMEIEQHLIDQVWDSVADLCVAAAVATTTNTTTITNETSTTTTTTTTMMPPMTWDWIRPMLSRVFLAEAPTLRKLGLYRFLHGSAGIQVDSSDDDDDDAKSKKADKDAKMLMLRPGKKRHMIKANKKGRRNRAPLGLVSVDFVLQAILPSYDTLGPSIGTNIQFEDNGKVRSEDISQQSVVFLRAYVQAIREEPDRLKEFFGDILSSTVVGKLRIKTAVLVYRTVADGLMQNPNPLQLPLDEAMVLAGAQALQSLFASASVVVTHREALLDAFATMLLFAKTTTLEPKTILKVLALYPIDHKVLDLNDSKNSKTFESLKKWLGNLGPTPNWASTVGASFASAFVQGDFAPAKWEPMSGVTAGHRSTGGAVVLLCALAGGTQAASSLLWPAIHKGLRSTPPSAALGWINADKASSALILLEFGCRLQILSGVGNGDLVVDGATQQMMRPPPNIETLLSNAVAFSMNHIGALTALERRPDTDEPSPSCGVKASGSTRSGNANQVSSLFATLISQFKVLKESFPSSMVMPEAADEMFRQGVQLLPNASGDTRVVSSSALVYAALSCGANPLLKLEGKSGLDVCRTLLNLEFGGHFDGVSKTDEQTARSVYHYARWGALSCMLPSIVEDSTYAAPALNDFLHDLFARANDLVEATPADALLPLFDTVTLAAKKWLASESGSDVYASNLTKIIKSLFAVMADASISETATYMLNEVCALLFRPVLLLDEYQRLEDNVDYDAPLRSSFRSLIHMAQTVRPYISKATLCRICAGWLGNGDEPSTAGLSAIPYCQDIVQLLVHKEHKADESSTNEAILKQEQPEDSNNLLKLPSGTNESSVARGFLLVFLSRLPNVKEGLHADVLTRLLHPLIRGIFDDVCFGPLASGSSIMIGTKDYSRRIRAWQSLCLLSRFVTEEIAVDVCEKTFLCMQQNLHGQIRYFIEMFTIQCSRRHPVLFGKKFCIEIRRSDISLQYISSLMIVGGNLLVGKYKNDFCPQFSSLENRTSLREVISGVLPWLSGTQGFSRAIAQLLTHDLITLWKDNADAAQQHEEDTWFLQNLFQFLDTNPDMKRLRKKQLKLFDQYDADEACTPEALLGMKVDSGDEPDPVHVVDLVKKCLGEVYLESREPMWKQVAELMSANHVDKSASKEEEDLVNFQRKIIPLDALDLALEESREQRLRNATGRKRQSLIVCATLIDKVPNLGGLARTAEIFAADRLVIPDANVTRMDNFKSISVGAGDWIHIEECKEDVSPQLSFLHVCRRIIVIPRSVQSTF